MGEGTFGRVLECWDRKRKLIVAVKVIRNVPKYRDAAMIEVRSLILSSQIPASIVVRPVWQTGWLLLSCPSAQPLLPSWRSSCLHWSWPAEFSLSA
jgi:hypothetical protein